MAKRCNLIAVKVLGDNGQGSTASVIAGVQWAVNDARSKGIKKSVSLSLSLVCKDSFGADTGEKVANMSLGSRFSQATNSAVAAAVCAGLTVIVAAGNDDKDACGFSPASEPLAYTIGSIDVTDRKSSYSNFGKGMISRSTLLSSFSHFGNPALTGTNSPRYLGPGPRHYQRLDRGQQCLKNY